MSEASVLILAALLAMTAGDRPSRVPDGAWGGDHIALTVTAEGATLDFDCAHGSIAGPLALDAEGRLESSGIYVREGPGPVREGAETGRPARYSGRLEGTTLTLSITLTDRGQSAGAYTLELGRRARIRKCG